MALTVSPIAVRIKQKAPGVVNITFPSMAIQPWDYQRNDIAWCLAQQQGLIAHGLAVGKTVLALGIASYLSDHGALDGMVVLCPKQTGAMLEQWRDEAARFVPGLNLVVAEGRDKADRVRAYRGMWDILVVNYEAARNDTPVLKKLFSDGRANVLYCDEASKFRTLSSKTARLVSAISRYFPYRYAATGTPIETDVEDIHSIFSAMGWQELVGTKAEFYRRYCIRERVTFYRPGGVKMSKWVTTGYQNLSELRAILEPVMIRRTTEDPEVAKHLPVVDPRVHVIPMTRKQAAVYRATKKKLVTEIGDQTLTLKYKDALGRFMRLLAVADSTQVLNSELPDESGKADWLIDALQTQYRGHKILVFSRFVRSLRPLSARLTAVGIEHGYFIGSSHQGAQERNEARDAFKYGSSQVLLATTALTYGLNLQVAKAVVFYGIVPNPKVLEQVMGRIRRAGSPYASLHSVTLLSKGTVEEGLYDSVIRRNALADFMWNEESVMFEKLGAAALEEMIRGG